jgi:hypothetical protein
VPALVPVVPAFPAVLVVSVVLVVPAKQTFLGVFAPLRAQIRA